MTENNKIVEVIHDVDIEAAREMNSIIRKAKKKESKQMLAKTEPSEKDNKKREMKQLLKEVAEEIVEEEAMAKKEMILNIVNDVEKEENRKREERERLEREEREEEERIEREKREEEERIQAIKEAEERLEREKAELRRKELAGLDNEIKLCPLRFKQDQPCFSNCALNVSNTDEPYCLVVMLASIIGEISGIRTFD
jgi:hypothetical protein